MKKKETLYTHPKVRHAMAGSEVAEGVTEKEKEEAQLLERTVEDLPKRLSTVALTGFGPLADPLEAVGPEVGQKLEAAKAASQVNLTEDGKKKDASVKKQSIEKNQGGEKASSNVFMTFEKGTSEDFAALFMGSEASPNKGMYEVGDEVEGLVVTIGRELVYVDLGAPYEGTARVLDYLNEEGELPFAAGERVTFYITGMRGGITLGRHMAASGASLEAVEQAFATGLPIEGRVESANKGGFVVMIGDVEAFCPISQIELGFTEDASVHLGNLYAFKVIEVRDDGRSVVVSRSAILEKEAREARERIVGELEVSQQLEGVVTRLADFGAFVDIGGVEGLLHISEIGFTHIDHPSEVLKEGERVKVEILEMGEVKGRLRISLSRRKCIQDPWETVAQRYGVGKEVNGTVTRTEEFGAFVELEPGIEGLVHVSEMSWNKRIRHASDVVSVGDRVLVRVLEVEKHRRRISLTMKSMESDPWVGIEEKLLIGQEVRGVVERIEDFGAFVNLSEPEVTGLLPRSEMGLTRNETPYSKVTVGKEVVGRVLNIDVSNRRLALTLKSEEELREVSGEEVAPTQYKDEKKGGSSLGTFGELLKKKLKE